MLSLILLEDEICHGHHAAFLQEQQAWVELESRRLKTFSSYGQVFDYTLNSLHGSYLDMTLVDPILPLPKTVMLLLRQPIHAHCSCKALADRLGFTAAHDPLPASTY